MVRQNFMVVPTGNDPVSFGYKPSALPLSYRTINFGASGQELNWHLWGTKPIFYH
jgi:hypothetical protein